MTSLTAKEKPNLAGLSSSKRLQYDYDKDSQKSETPQVIPEKNSLVEAITSEVALTKQSKVLPLNNTTSQTVCISDTSSSLEDFDHLRITDSTEIPEPKVFMKIYDETITTDMDITVFSGGQKSGKSAITAPVIAAAITKDGIIEDPIEGIEVAPNPHSFAVIHIDTEQARHKHLRNLKGILKRAKKQTCPDHLLSYNIRQLNLEDYQRITSGICLQAKKKFGKIHVVIIDGIADYIKDVNDQAESNAIIKYLEHLAIEFEAPIIVILHTNPGSDKERGHIGSQLLRKAGSVIGIKTDGDVSYLEPKYLRYAGKGNIPTIQFIYDKEEGYHVGFGTRENPPVTKDIDRVSKTKKLCEVVFAPPSALSYKDAIEKIMKESKKAIATSKALFAEMKAHEIIIQGDDKNWRLNSKNL